MDRTEKLRLSAESHAGYAFREGLFVRLYEQSLYWFVLHVRPLKVLTLPVKKGGVILCGGLPEASFEALRREGKLRGVVAEDAACRWIYTEQSTGGAEGFSGYAAWREAALAAGVKEKPLSPGDRDILREIRDFDLLDCTPMRAMSAIHEWREYLLHGGGNWERAGNR